ncbi:molecular chaperone DnaK [Pseudoxanthomonas jiangsuensis]|uniref:TraR/DksA C4-type zinc finger protein n=1 Tax=Pseudoxanthomonas jiangsuensis TaxID=619688 RepID=UPI0013907AD3|nr:TraR/DksA C4-type zinc finger protein [Pseudoxanthomonas jiangsuensis]KAF1692748.1 molecular chaperone DnaK [Pseudoxanthomonas jiangsuensis]
MHDAADKAAEDEERAMQLFEEGLRARRRPIDAGSIQVIQCLDCGDDVSVERQLAVPRTRRCTRCAAEVERR